MQRAIRTVRSRAAEWGVDPAKIGAGGFSAGGELAQLVALRNDAGKADAADPVERVSSRPDFQVLIYPGKSQLIQPVPGSPPAFLAAGFDDRPDISTGLAEAYLRFKKAGVQAELHMYANVGHGFGVRPERAGQSQQEWTTQLVSFLRQAKLIARRPADRSAARVVGPRRAAPVTRGSHRRDIVAPARANSHYSGRLPLVPCLERTHVYVCAPAAAGLASWPCTAAPLHRSRPVRRRHRPRQRDRRTGRRRPRRHRHPDQPGDGDRRDRRQRGERGLPVPQRPRRHLSDRSRDPRVLESGRARP